MPAKVRFITMLAERASENFIVYGTVRELAKRTDLIISHKHRFIFFAVPKTATHAIRQALREHMGPDDWEQQVLFGKQSLPIPEIAKIRHGHISVRQIRPHIAAQVWDNYFKFCFVRNPFDRYVSTCFFLNRSNPNFSASAVSFMKQALSRQQFRQRILVQPQVMQLRDTDDEIALDYVGRYETVQQSYDEICERIGIPATDLARKNPSRHAAYADYYDDELRGIVGEFYKDDLASLGYGFAPSDQLAGS